MQVRVWNDNVHPFKQEIHEKVYSIPAKECIELEEDEADVLIKRISPVLLDGNDQPKPESYKMLRIDKDDLHKNRMLAQNKGRSGTYVCQACGYVAANKWELSGHAQDMHEDQFEDYVEAKSAIAGEARARKKKQG